MTDFLTRPVSLLLIAALAYAAATIAMKASSQSGSLLLIALVALCLTTAVLAEILVLRNMDLGLAYVTILALESLAVLGVAWMMGDAMGPRQMLGGACVLAGALMLST